MVNTKRGAMAKAVLVSLAALRLASAGPAANVRLGSLLKQADAVVVGSVRSASSAAGVVLFDISVLRVIKGPILLGSDVTAAWQAPAASVGGVDSSARQTGVWFLQRQSSGWTVLPVMTGSISINQTFIAVPGAAPAYSFAQTGLPEDLLAQEIGGAAQDASTAPGIGGLVVVGALDDLASSHLSPIWNQISVSISASGRAIALTALIRSGVTNALSIVAAAGPAAFGAEGQNYLARAICDYRGTDASGTATLGGFIASGSDAMKPCAAHALRSIHSQATLPFLKALLDSSSSDLRYEAVAGIASYANGLPVQSPNNIANLQFLQPQPDAKFASDETRQYFPTRDGFSQKEQVYITYWKTWLNSHQ